MIYLIEIILIAAGLYLAAGVSMALIASFTLEIDRKQVSTREIILGYADACLLWLPRLLALVMRSGRI